MYFLKDKSVALTSFKHFEALVEAENGYKLLTLQSNRGGKYTSNVFQDYYREQGIKRQLTTTYTP